MLIKSPMQKETAQTRQMPRVDRVMPPPYRRLRGYAFDPSLSIRLDTAQMNDIVFKVMWEDRDDISKGPVGEYLEVVDFDPASGCFYEPVDLETRILLAQDGLAPSEGNPQFHQQMVYAVAMTTIRHFETGPGPAALWAPAPGSIAADGDVQTEQYVQRLRIYPHALREANAYYSPDKKALLFGYFPASVEHRGQPNLPGGTGLHLPLARHRRPRDDPCPARRVHPRFIEPTNPDALAFHEAFADIVALFQHFTFPDVLRHQIARTRGDLASQNLLGQLAQQFGRPSAITAALRDALGTTDPVTGQWKPATRTPTTTRRCSSRTTAGRFWWRPCSTPSSPSTRAGSRSACASPRAAPACCRPEALHPDLVGRLGGEASRKPHGRSCRCASGPWTTARRWTSPSASTCAP